MRFVPLGASVAVFVLVSLVVARGDAGTLVPVALTAFLEGLSVAFLWIPALGFGRALQRALLPQAEGHALRFALHGGLGMAALMTAVHLLGLAGAVHPILYAALGAAGLALFLRDRPWQGFHTSLFRHPMLPVAALLLSVLFVAASFPPGHLWAREAGGYDALEYHLQVPREWLAASRIVPLPHNVYGYLPLNLEMLSLPLFSLRGGAWQAMLAVQWLHASFAAATALLLGLWIGGKWGSAAGWGAGLAFLCVPWTLVTGSLAYNEAAAAFFIAGALVVVWEAPSLRAAAAAGVIAGGAVAVKLTAVGFGAAPVLAALALAPHEDRSARTLAKRAGLVAAGTLLLMAPYLVRNAVWTGNPVFPLATRALGRAHWSETEEWRWIKAHRSEESLPARAGSLWSKGLADPGFGPPFWLAVAAALALAWRRRDSRPVASALAAFVSLQLAFWLAATHVQPRFLHPLAIPLSAALGLGAAALPPRCAWIALSLFALGHGAWHVTHLRHDGNRPGIPPASDALADPYVFLDVDGTGPLAGQRVLLVGEATAFMYPPGTIYATPFETSLFAKRWRERRGDARAVLSDLKAAGVTLVVVNWNEVERLRATYGIDAEISRENVARLVAAGAVRMEGSGESVDLLRLP